MIISQMIALKLLAGASAVDVVPDDTVFGAGDDQILDEDDLMLAIIKDVAGKL